MNREAMPATSRWLRARSLSVERACLALLQSDIDIAFSFLRLADAEARGGNAAHADELIGKATETYKNLLNRIGTVPAELEDEQHDLQRGMRSLREAIHLTTSRYRAASAVPA